MKRMRPETAACGPRRARQGRMRASPSGQQTKELPSDKSSWKAGEETADRGGGGGGDVLVGHGRVQGCGKIVCGGSRAGTSEIHVPIIDAAVIEKATIGGKHGGFWSNLNLCLFHERVVWVAEDREMVAIFLCVFTDLIGGFGLDGIDEIERGVSSVVRAHCLDGGRVTIGDGAVGAHKKKHDNFSGGVAERIDDMAI